MKNIISVLHQIKIYIWLLYKSFPVNFIMANKILVMVLEGGIKIKCTSSRTMIIYFQMMMITLRSTLRVITSALK